MFDDDRNGEKHKVKTDSSGQEVCKIIGPALLAIATILLLISISSSGFSVFGMFFVVIPFYFIGGILTKYGYGNQAPRYQPAPKPPVAPVVKAGTNYVVKDTKESIQPVKEVIIENVKKEEPSKFPCSYCGHKLEVEAKFCSECGRAVIKTCPLCNSENQGNAKFCVKCGEQL